MMSMRSLFYVLLSLTGLFFTRNKVFADLFEISDQDGRRLAIIDGKLLWCKAGETLWIIKKTGSGDTVQVGSRGKWKHWYLTYDSGGKDCTVKLTEKPVSGSYWKVGNKDARPSFLDALGGKVKGYSLDRGEEVKKVKGDDGETYRTFKVNLVEKPKHVRHVIITVIAP